MDPAAHASPSLHGPPEADLWAPRLVQRAAESLGASRALLGETAPDSSDDLLLIAAWPADSMPPGRRLALEGTPCGDALRDGSTYVDSDVGARFPRYVEIVGTDVRSVLSIRLPDDGAGWSGCLAVLHTEPIVRTPERIAVLEALALAAAAELRRERTERSLRQYERRLRSIADNVPGIVYSYVIGPDGRHQVLFAAGGEKMLGPRLARETGYDQELFFARVVHPDDRPLVLEAGRVARVNLEPVDVEYRIRTEFGERWVRSISSPLLAPDGQVTWNGLMIDVTEHREMRERAQEYSEALIVANEALYAAKVAAEQAAAARDASSRDPEGDPADPGPRPGGGSGRDAP